MKSCKRCGLSVKDDRNKYCSVECRYAQMRQNASRMCLCCGKMWYRHEVTRKQSKYKTSRFHNCFCSRQCAKKYVTWETDRGARCNDCGKATGDGDAVKCEECKLPPLNTWDRLFVQFMNKKHEHKPKSWDDKLSAMIATNMHREAIAKPPRELKLKQKRKTKRRSAWIDKWNEACLEMILNHNRERNKEKDPWRKKLGNWQTNQKKRMRIKEHRSRLKECEQS